MADKPTYSIKFTLKSSRPDAIAAALKQLHELAGDVDESGEVAATLTIESMRESNLDNIRDNFERWLFEYIIGMDCEVTTKAPGLRPETRQALMRAKQQTPMDRTGWEKAATPGERVMEFLTEREK